MVKTVVVVILNFALNISHLEYSNSIVFVLFTFSYS